MGWQLAISFLLIVFGATSLSPLATKLGLARSFVMDLCVFRISPPCVAGSPNYDVLERYLQRIAEELNPLFGGQFVS